MSSRCACCVWWQSLPRLCASLWLLSGHGASRYYDDLAVSQVIHLLNRCLLMAPDLRPLLLQSGIFPFLLASCMGPQVPLTLHSTLDVHERQAPSLSFGLLCASLTISFRLLQGRGSMSLEAAAFLKSHHVSRATRDDMTTSSLTPYLPMQLIKVSGDRPKLYLT